MDLNTEQP